MRIINEYKDPLVHTLRQGDSTDPYIEIEELQVIQNNRILLSEVPNRLQRVQLKIKGYAKARLQFHVDEIEEDFSVYIAGQEYRVRRGSVRQALRNLTKAINGASEYVYAVYFVAARSVDVIAKNNGFAGNTIVVSADVDPEVAEWVDRKGNPTPTLVDGSDAVETYYEIEEGIPKENEFKVNYTLGIVEFHDSANGFIGEFKYYGRGLTYYPASRVWVRLENNTVVETLEDVIEDAHELIEELKDIEFNLVALGEYDPERIYYKRNIVKYKGSSYMYTCEEPSAGLVPDTSSCWKLIAEKGDKGDPGINLKFRGAYDENRLYQPEDAVEFNGSVFYCHTETLGNLPTNKDYWHLFVSGGGTKDYRNTVKIQAPQTVVNIGIPQYEEDRDILIVHANSTFIEEGVDYEVVNSQIVSKKGAWEENTEFNFMIIKNINMPNAKFDGEYLEDETIDGSQKLIDGSVTTEKIKDNAITTEKIVDGSITMPKLGEDVLEELDRISNEVATHTHDASDINSGVLNIARIPNLPASKTTSGVFHIDRIPNIPANKITGKVASAANADNANTVGGMTVQQIIESSKSIKLGGRVIRRTGIFQETEDWVTVFNLTNVSGFINGLKVTVGSRSGTVSYNVGEARLFIDGVLFDTWSWRVQNSETSERTAFSLFPAHSHTFFFLPIEFHNSIRLDSYVTRNFSGHDWELYYQMF